MHQDYRIKVYLYSNIICTKYEILQNCIIKYQHSRHGTCSFTSNIPFTAKRDYSRNVKAQLMAVYFEPL